MIFSGKKNNKKKQEIEVVEPEKMSLYLLMDAPKIGIVQYMRENGIELKGIFYDILEANYEFMQEDTAARIAIIETGVGLFSKVENREEIISLIGMCQTDLKRAVVFYTDTAFKSTVNKEMPKTQVSKYVSTLGVIEELEKYNEEYCLGGAEDTVIESMLQYTGEELNYEVLKQSKFNIGSLESVIGDKDDTIQTFQVKY